MCAHVSKLRARFPPPSLGRPGACSGMGQWSEERSQGMQSPLCSTVQAAIPAHRWRGGHKGNSRGRHTPSRPPHLKPTRMFGLPGEGSAIRWPRRLWRVNPESTGCVSVWGAGRVPAEPWEYQGCLRPPPFPSSVAPLPLGWEAIPSIWALREPVCSQRRTQRQHANPHIASSIRKAFLSKQKCQ